MMGGDGCDLGAHSGQYASWPAEKMSITAEEAFRGFHRRAALHVDEIAAYAAFRYFLSASVLKTRTTSGRCAESP